LEAQGAKRQYQVEPAIGDFLSDGVRESDITFSIITREQEVLAIGEPAFE